MFCLRIAFKWFTARGRCCASKISIRAHMKARWHACMLLIHRPRWKKKVGLARWCCFLSGLFHTFLLFSVGIDDKHWTPENSYQTADVTLDSSLTSEEWEVLFGRGRETLSNYDNDTKIMYLDLTFNHTVKEKFYPIRIPSGQFFPQPLYLHFSKIPALLM